jgi:D-alanine-D-alanine ligase
MSRYTRSTHLPSSGRAKSALSDRSTLAASPFEDDHSRMARHVPRRTLVVLGSLTSENDSGEVAGRRVAAALNARGWTVEVCHASEGYALLQRLLRDPPDVVVPVGFGAPAEDGHIFAITRMVGIPCAGPTPATGGVMQDKSALSRFVDSVFAGTSGVRSPRGIVLTNGISRTEAELRVASLRPPLVVKPGWSGSSDGLGVFTTAGEALAAAAKLLPWEGKVLVQELEHPIEAEISCTVLDDASGPTLLPIVELRRDDVTVLGPAEKVGSRALGRHVIPARLSAGVAARVEQAVLSLHESVGAVGLTRYDLLIHASGDLIVLDANGIPGLLEGSIACAAAAAAGMAFDELVVRFAESAFLPRPEPMIWNSAPGNASADSEND